MGLRDWQKVRVVVYEGFAGSEAEDHMAVSRGGPFAAFLEGDLTVAAPMAGDLALLPVPLMRGERGELGEPRGEMRGEPEL